MNELMATPSGALEKFKPETTITELQILDAAIDLALRMRNWPEARHAIKKQIEVQHKFVHWWREHVTPGQSPGINQWSVAVAQPTTLPAQAATKRTGIGKSQVSRWTAYLEDKQAYENLLFEAALAAAMAKEKDSQLIQQSQSNEHYTPAVYIEAARKVLGGIDLDPASCAEANKIVKAKKFFDREGENRDWRGRIWLNPPYGKNPGPGPFIARLIDQMETGNVSAAIVLVNAHCTDTDWFQSLWNGNLCFTDHRINFAGDEERSGSTHGSVFVYFGGAHKRFIKHFAQFGAIVARM